MRSSHIALLVLAALLFQGCKLWPFGGSDSDLKTPAYYGTYSIAPDGNTSELWADDVPPELPETVTFLVHEKAVSLAQDNWTLSRLSVSGPSVPAGTYSWDEWYKAHGINADEQSANTGNFPVNAASVRLRRRPVSDEAEMIILEPAAPLTPGPYQLGEGLRFWVARQQFNLELSAAADAAVQDGDLRRAYNLAESAKLWNAGNLALVAQFNEIQARIVQVDGGGTTVATAPGVPEVEPSTIPAKAGPAASSRTLSAEAAFRQATTAFDSGEWALALEAALEAMKIDRASKTRTTWPNHRRFRDPIDVMLGIVTSPEIADPVVVCETSEILARAGEKRAVPAMAEALGVINLQTKPAERLSKSGVSCLIDALVAMKARPATPMLRNCLSHTLSDLKTRASAERFVNALVTVDSAEWRRFSPSILDKVYDQFIYVNDRGAEAVRVNPIDTESPHVSKIDMFLAKIGRWDVTDAANRSGLEMGGNIGTKIIDRDLIELTYRITGQSSGRADQFTLILRTHSSREMPWRIYDIRDIRIQGKPFPGDGSVASSEFEPVSSAPIDNVGIPPISIGGIPARPAVPIEPDIAALSETRPGGPRIASRPPGTPPTDVVSAICPGGTVGTMRHGTWYRQYFMDDALVDVRPADDPSPEEHNDAKDLIHTGIDILAPEGSAVHALSGGLVRTVIANENDGSFRALGYAVIVRHAQGGKQTYCLYSHLKEPPKLRTGGNISAGDLIGHTGKTGGADKAKVHVEIRHFNHVFDHKLFDAFGNPMTQDPTTFDMQYFNSKWSDPLQFGL
jgi:murein DD-endopeptidase MepM/ murein hydrolase activator NlpD